MKAWFWTLLVFIAAVGLALVLRDHSGNVLIVAQPWRIELSLALAVLLVLACFVILYIVLRVLAWISGGTERFRSWRSLRSQKREHEMRSEERRVGKEGVRKWRFRGSPYD